LKIQGIKASEGIAIYPVLKYVTTTVEVTDELVTDTDKSILLLDNAIQKTISDLEKLRLKMAESIDEEHAMIFDAHIEMAKDPELYNKTKQVIEETSINPAKALSNVAEEFINMFLAMDNEYFKERATDIKDVTTRMIKHLLGIEDTVGDLDHEVIVVADDLTPSDTAKLDLNYVKGFITNIGGRTSHSVILARSLEIPAIVGTKVITEQVEDGDKVILDGFLGQVITSPSEEEVTSYQAQLNEWLKEKDLLQDFKDKKSITKDGHIVELAANIGSPSDMDNVLHNGSEGIGLYRTEFLYMDNDHLPTEEEQYKAYKEVLEKMPNKKVVIRTLDIGGDKHLEYLPLDQELNPFLGHRALRLCLEKTDLFKTQLKALLRASLSGNLHIMFPMVATLQELRDAKMLVQECKEELHDKGIEFGEPKIGIMVEIPAVAILADQFAKEVDFFSIGTNDLIQYSFAADRMNQKVSYLYQPLNPSLLRLIKMVIDASHKEGIWTGMCGEMAGDIMAAPVLLGLGLDEFSMSPSGILKVRQLFSTLNFKDMQTLATNSLACDSQEQVHRLIKNIVGE
jgi:phosphotransferase system enzyme I (PtsI)